MICHKKVSMALNRRRALAPDGMKLRLSVLRRAGRGVNVSQQTKLTDLESGLEDGAFGRRIACAVCTRVLFLTMQPLFRSHRQLI
jgi:hypothetical protein